MQHKLRDGLFPLMVLLSFIHVGVLLQPGKGIAAAENAATTSSAATGAGKVASVNGTAISQEKFDNAISYQQEIAAIRGVTITDEQMSELRYEVLEGLIDTELLYQESQKSGIQVGEAEINEAYETNRQKAKFETDAEFEEALKKSNKTIASYKAEIKQGLAVDRFIKNRFTDKTAVSDSEAKKYYDENPGYFQEPPQVRISHIMVSVPSNADQSVKDEAKTKMEDVKRRLKTGDNFEDLAKEVSDDVSSRENGGDLGFISEGQTPQTFEDAAFALNKGEISDIVKTDSGYHILKLTDKTDAKKISYEDARKDIVDGMKTTKVNSAVSKYIIVLRNRSTIVTYPVSK